jgi:hypothetical protein
VENQQELVSIILPCYNVQDYLKDALESVIRQSYNHWEAIIVNDGSVDHTKEVALEYINKDKRFILINQVNKGLSAARKAGLHVAKGDFVQFLDADDVLLPDRIETMLNVSKDVSHMEILYSSFLIGLDNKVNGEIIKPSRSVSIGRNIKFYDLYKDWEENIIFIPACVFFRKSIFSSIIYDSSYKSCEDLDLYLNFLSCGYELRYVDKFNVIYRDNPQGLSKNTELINQCFVNVLSKWKYIDKRCERVFLHKCSIIVCRDFLNLILQRKTPINYFKNKEIGYPELFSIYFQGIYHLVIALSRISIKKITNLN